MLEHIHPGWRPLFDAQEALLSEIFRKLEGVEFVPAAHEVFRAFEFPPEHYRVLILGQDPYPNPQHAMGLAFCTPAGTKPMPPSLRNILLELADDLGPGHITFGDIAGWPAAGVMLLNRHLTTSAGEVGGHFDIGWANFTRAAVEFLNEVRSGRLVAILWGNRAQEIASSLPGAHLICSAHPSPLSARRGFFGSHPFSACNKALLELGEKPIDWSC